MKKTFVEVRLASEKAVSPVVKNDVLSPARRRLKKSWKSGGCKPRDTADQAAFRSNFGKRKKVATRGVYN